MSFIECLTAVEMTVAEDVARRAGTPEAHQEFDQTAAQNIFRLKEWAKALEPKPIEYWQGILEQEESWRSDMDGKNLRIKFEPTYGLRPVAGLQIGDQVTVRALIKPSERADHGRSVEVTNQKGEKFWLHLDSFMEN